MKKNNYLTMWTVILGVLFWGAVLRLPSRLVGNNLDDSWMAVLQYAHLQHWQFGKDISFTYGPLGYLFLPAYLHPQFLPPMMVASVGFATIITLLYVLWLMSLAKEADRLMYGVPLIYVAAASLSDANLILFLLLLTIPSLLMYQHFESKNQSRLMTALIVITQSVLGMLVLYKGTLLMPALVIAGGQWLLLLLGAQWRRAVLALSTFISTLVGVWVLLGQNVMGLPAYLTQLIAVSQGYTTAMSLTESLPMRTWGLFTVLGIAGVWCWLLLEQLRLTQLWRQKFGLIVWGLTQASLVFLAWKHGFVRADGHMEIFIAAVPMVIIMWLSQWGQSLNLERRVALLVVTAMVYLVGLRLLPGANPQLSVVTLSNRWADNLAILANLKPLLVQPMPDEPSLWDASISAHLKAQPIDVYAVNQAQFIKQGYTYQPRPIFQSYSAYTSQLAHLNFAYLHNRERGSLIYAQVFAIDDRYPLQDDALAWWEMITRYSLVTTGHDAVVLQKELSSTTPHFSPWVSQEVSFNQAIPVEALPAHAWLKLKFTPTLMGKILTLGYKPAHIKMQVKFSDGTVRVYRVLPATAQDGFLIHPAIVTTQLLSEYLSQQEVPKIVELQFSQDGITSYQNTIQLSIEKIN